MITPATSDHTLLINALASVTPESVSKGGSDLPKAILESIARFDTKEAGKIILWSDGTDTSINTSELEPSIRSHKQVSIDTIGMGGTDPVPIPLGRDVFGNTRYLTFEGKVITTT